MKLATALFGLFLSLWTGLPSQAQSLTLPPSGANQKAIVTQYVGALAHITVTYNSPDVTGPSGEDRQGQIWGNLVPYGMTDLGFGLREPAPWRAGANENTVIELSHDMLVEGQPLAAGRYGFHLMAAENGPWTAIFSHNANAWGSFYYRQEDDALRVPVTPQSGAHTEWLSFDFPDKEETSTTMTLRWETMVIPVRFDLPDPAALYLANMRLELTGAAGLDWRNWQAAASYCVAENTNLDEALLWAEQAISLPFVGQSNFTTLQTKSKVLRAMGKTTEADAIMTAAISDPSATAFNVHQYGRQLIGQGETSRALAVMEANHRRFDGAWPTNVGMMRGLSAEGRYKPALRYARKALEQAPDALNRSALEMAIQKLEKGEDVN